MKLPHLSRPKLSSELLYPGYSMRILFTMPSSRTLIIVLMRLLLKAPSLHIDDDHNPASTRETQKKRRQTDH